MSNAQTIAHESYRVRLAMKSGSKRPVSYLAFPAPESVFEASMFLQGSIARHIREAGKESEE